MSNSNLVIKGDFVIANPLFGKLSTYKLLTSDSCIHTVTGNVTGKYTDAYAGGAPAVWSGNNAVEYGVDGLQNTTGSGTATSYINHDPVKNMAISFEIVKMDAPASTFIVNLRSINGDDNYSARISLTSDGVILSTRTSVSFADILEGSIPAGVGDKVELEFIENTLKLSINDSLYKTYELEENIAADLNRAGYISISRGSSLNYDDRTAIKNIQISELV